MKGILINPFKKTLTEIINNNIKDVYKELTNKEIGEVNMIERFPLGPREYLWLDEEGLFKAQQKRFAIPPLTGFQTFAGIAIILGENQEGDSWCDTKINIEELYNSIVWEK